jgi:hypothetical protein
MDGVNPTRALGIGFELGAQAGDVVIDGARGWEGGVPPDDIEETLARDGFAGAFGQKAEHGEFLGGEVERLLGAPGALLNEINASVAKLERPRNAPLAMGTPKKSADAGEQFLGAERFDEVIIRAGVETGDTILDLAFGSEHENENGMIEAAQLGTEGEPIEMRQHDVEQHQVGLFIDRALEAGLAVDGGEDTVTFGLEAILKGGAHGQLVLNDEEALVHDSGSSMVKRLPWPGSLRTVTRPWCASTMCLTMLKPIPTP